MKTITVNSKKNGTHLILLDDEDYEYLSELKWYVFKSRHFLYAVTMIYNKETKRQKSHFLHRMVMKISEPGNRDKFIDHVDHNGFNCQKSNLRICTNRQNQMNKISRGRSKYLGVWYNRGSIVSKIRINKKQVTIGQGFKTEEEAARAYDEMAKIHHGEFANLNFK